MPASFEVALATLVLCMGVLAVGGHRRTLILAIILVLPAVLGNWVNHMSSTLFVGVLIARLVSFYSTAGPVEAADNRPIPLATIPGTSHSQRTPEESAPDGQRP